jgi:hypothetical protein
LLFNTPSSVIKRKRPELYTLIAEAIEVKLNEKYKLRFSIEVATETFFFPSFVSRLNDSEYLRGSVLLVLIHW